MPKAFERLALLLIPLFLLGCPPPEEEPTPMQDPDTPAVDREVEADRPEPGHQETVSLDEVEGSGITGEAEITVAAENETLVMVSVEGASPEASLMAHVHRGDCDPIGDSVHELETVAVDAEGRGAGTTTLDVAPTQLLDGNHAVVVMGDAGQPVACGEIPEYGTLTEW